MLGRVLWCCGLAVWVGVEGGSVTGISSSGCSGGNTTELTGCAGGTVLTISGSGFNQNDPSKNVISFGGGTGDPPSCYPLWTDLSSGLLKCNLFMFSGYTAGPWGLVVTSDGNPSTESVSLTISPAAPVLTSAECPRSCEHGTTLQLVGYFLSTYVEAYFAGSFAPSCTTVLTTNTTILCNISVVPGYSGDKDVYAANVITSQISSPVLINVKNAVPEVQWITGTDCTISGRVLTTHGAVLAGCAPGNTHITLHGLNFNKEVTTVHSVQFTPNTEAFATLSPAFVATNDPDVPVPICETTNSTAHSLVCWLEVFYTAAYYITLSLNGITDNNVHRIYTNSPVPDVHNVSGCGDTVNDTLHCMTGTTLVIMGDGFIPSRIGKGTYNTITFEGGYGPPPACSYIRSTVRYLSCTLSVTAGGRGPWEFKITIGDKSASPPFTLTPHIKQPYISLIEGVYCNSYVCESTGGNEAARVITITGHEFAEDPWGNMVLFTGGEVGYNGQAPSCTPLTATARILTCNLVGAPGVSGWWSLTVQVGSTKAYPFHSPVKVIPPPTNNITLDVPKEVFIDEPFTLFVRTSVWSWRDPLSHWGVSNVSLLWWDGSPVRNDAALKGVTSSNVVDFGSDGQYTLPGVGVSLPGHYIVLLLVSMEDSWISVLRATSVVKVLPLSTSVPIVTSASGCSAHSGLKAWCDHGDVLALHGENFGPDPEVIFVSASGGQLTCANSLHDDAVPPLLLICQLDASEPMYKLFTGRVAGAQEVFEVMIFRPSVKTVVVSAEPNEVTSGATVVLRGTGFYLDSARNTIKFVAAEHAAGPVPSCAPGEIVTTSALECTVHCAPATWGWWLLVVNNEMSQVVLNCTTPPKMSPTVNSVEGCSAYNATLIDCAAGTTVTLHGSDFGVPIHNNVVQLQKVQNGIYAGDLPSFCILDAAASTVSMLKCVFTSPPESYGVFTVNVYNGVGWGEAAVLLRLLHGTLAQQGVVFHSGCKGEVTLSSATYKDYCQHGTQLTMLGKGLDWRIEKSTTLLAAVGTANSGAQPTCTLTTLFPVSTQPYPQEYYQSLTCTLYVPLETVGLWSLSINGVEVAGLKLDRMTAPVILSMEPFGECSNATELYECHTAEGTGGLLFVLENPPQEATYTRYRLVGGEGSAPRCTGGMYECVLECDETCSGMWGVVVANTEGGDFVSAVYEGAKVKCYTPATMPVLLSSVSQCEFCSSGTILTVHGSGFDTKDATSNRVHLLSTGSSLSSLYPPNCTVLAVSYTQLTCEIGTHYTTGGFWSVSVMRVTTGSVTNDTNHTIRPFMEPGEAPLLVKGWSEVIHDTGEVVVVIEGKHFNAQLLSNSVTITRTVGSLGPTPTCDLRSSSIVLLRCLVQGTDATHGLWGVELMTSAGAASLVDPVQITAMPIIVNKITGCEQDVRSGNVIYCELQTGFSVQGFNLPGEVVWLWGGSGTPAAVPTCGTLFAQPTSLTCSTIVLVAAAHGLWVAQMGTVYQHMLLYSNPQAPMVVNAVLGDAKNDTLLTLVGDNFHPVYYKNEIVCNVTCVPVAADVDGKKLVVWVYEAKEVTGAVLIGGIIMQWAVVTETLMLERTATATIGDIMLSSATATVSLVEATQGFEFTLAGDVASFNETDFILTVSAVLAADPSTVQVVSVHAASIIVTFHIPETLTSVLIDHLANSSSPLWASIPALLSGTTLIPSTDSPYVSSDSSPVLIVVLSLVGTVCTTSIAVLCWWFRVKDAKRSVAAVTEQAPATPVNKMDVGDNPEPDMMIGTPSTVRHVPSEHDEDCLHVDDSSETVEEERTGVPTTVVSVVGEGLQQTETMCEDFASVHTGAGVTTHEPVAGWDVASGMFGDLTSPSAPSVTHSQGCSLALDSWSPAQPNDILLGHKSLKANPPKPKVQNPLLPF